MQLNPYLRFKGECEAAFKVYEQCLGGQLGAIFRYGGTPLASHVPADWSDKVMHGSCRSRRRSGLSVLACSSIASAYRG